MDRRKRRSPKLNFIGLNTQLTGLCLTVSLSPSGTCNILETNARQNSTA